MIIEYMILNTIASTTLVDSYLDYIDRNNIPAAHAISETLCKSMYFGYTDIGYVVERLAKAKKESSEIAMLNILNCYQEYVCVRFHATPEYSVDFNTETEMYENMSRIFGITTIVWLSSVFATIVALQFPFFMGSEEIVEFGWLTPTIGIAGLGTAILPASLYIYSAYSLNHERKRIIKCGS